MQLQKIALLAICNPIGSLVRDGAHIAPGICTGGKRSVAGSKAMKVTHWPQSVAAPCQQPCQQRGCGDLRAAAQRGTAWGATTGHSAWDVSIGLPHRRKRSEEFGGVIGRVKNKTFWITIKFLFSLCLVFFSYFILFDCFSSF